MRTANWGSIVDGVSEQLTERFIASKGRLSADDVGSLMELDSKLVNMIEIANCNVIFDDMKKEYSREKES